MRRLVALSFVLAAVSAVPAAAQTHPNFTGSWVLDPAKSVGPMIPQAMELDVSHTDKSLSITRHATGPRGPQTTTLVYQLDGTTSKNTVGGNGMTVDLNSTTTWAGDTLVVKTTAPTMQGGMQQTERWNLEPGGKQLTLNGDISISGQSATAKMVFTKK